ncbi:short-chain dehydrogenase [Acrocarpospora pleiomorpha]|uniref:Short-chain dehydrogenase n=1 Tax=Acrocarpospora pleiomorpha TaxID=90975 RepID=A0A5M3XJA9_9ACTN|nr:SDR family NAD(P)-dependent oxidoreductase [Acrocarpospora pleiomorpha]GES20862.1 short-chain dehydrogenase [Acrocarpospora pleiomorpha]
MTVVVTGGNRGIGYAVCERLARAGKRVVLVSRDRERGAAAIRALPGEVDLVVGDLTTFAGVRILAEELRRICPRIEVLVHNAGLWPSRRVLTADGVEESFAINHLAPFLLNHLLEDLLGRVVQVSAGLYAKGKVNPDRTPQGLDFHPIRTYADTKLCNVLMLPLFARRWEDAGVTIDAVHPGVIRTGLGDRGGPAGLLLKAAKRFWLPPEKGAEPVVRLALENTGTGRFFNVNKEIPIELDEDLARRVWTQAAELTGAG